MRSDALYRRLQRRARARHRSVAQEAIHLLAEAIQPPEPRSLLELKGLGKQAWKGIDAARHVSAERESWD